MDFVHSRFGTHDAAEYAVSSLLEAGFARSMISLRRDDPGARSPFGAGASTHTESHRVSHTRVVGALGGIVGALLGAAVAPFALSVSSTTLTETAMVAVATGACMLGVLGSRVALCLRPEGDDDPDAEPLMSSRDGSVVMVRARMEHADRASRILERCGGGCVSEG